MTDENDKKSHIFLIADVHRQVATAFADADDLDITRMQAKVLLSIWRNEGPTQKQVATRLDMQCISISRLVDDLQAKGMVVRKPDPEDRRKNRLYITQETKPLIASIRAQLDEITESLLAPLSPDERDVLHTLLTKIIT